LRVTEISEEWMDDYNNYWPHESLGGVPPKKYKSELAY